MEPSTRLDELLSQWQKQRESGTFVRPEELCANDPDLLTQLKEKIQALSSMEGFLQSTKDFVSAPDQPTSDPDATGNYQSKSDLEVPETIGHYEIRGEIARGGMGAVLRAYDPDFDRTLALKVTLDKHQGHEQAEKRFLEEAKITGKLQHPGIPPVYELGHLPDGRPFFAMKLIDGQTLSEMLKARKSPADNLPHFLGVFEQICQTIAYAHSQNVIHRDLKPLNIMVGAFGEVQVMDWGLAKKLGANQWNDTALSEPIDTANNNPEMTTDWQNEGAMDEESRTRAGAILGTVTHMAPEQARGEIAAIDKASDVFGLGAILCQILTGEPPFTGKTVADIVSKAQEGDWQSSRDKLEQSGVDAELVALTKKCLEKNKAQRFANAAELAQAIADYQEGVQEKLKQTELERATAQANAASERKRRRTQLTAVGVVVALLTVGIVAAVWGIIQIDTAREAEKTAKLVEQKKSQQLAESNELIYSIFADLNIRDRKKQTGPVEQLIAERLITAAKKLKNDYGSDPLTVAMQQSQLGTSLTNLGFADDALPFLQEASQTFTSLRSNRDEVTIRINVNLADCHYHAGNYELAMDQYENLLPLIRAVLGETSREALATLNNAALCCKDAGQVKKSLVYQHQAYEATLKRFGANHLDTVIAQTNLAMINRELGNTSQLAPTLEANLETLKQLVGPNHVETLLVQRALGTAHYNRGQIEKGLDILGQTLQSMYEELGEVHPLTLQQQQDLGMAFCQIGQGEKGTKLILKQASCCLR